ALRASARGRALSAFGSARSAVVTLACAGALLGGGESAAGKCDKARAAATTAWDAYLAGLQKARAAAAPAPRDSQAKLSGEVEPRLSPAAEKSADSRYPRSSDAWGRAQAFALHEACIKDAACSAQKRRHTDAQQALTDLDERLPLARAAAAAIR